MQSVELYWGPRPPTSNSPLTTMPTPHCWSTIHPITEVRKRVMIPHLRNFVHSDKLLVGMFEFETDHELCNHVFDVE